MVVEPRFEPDSLGCRTNVLNSCSGLLLLCDAEGGLSPSLPACLPLSTLSIPRFPWWFSGRQSVCQCRRHGFYHWIGKTPWRKTWNSFRYSCLGNPIDSRAWPPTVHGVTKNWTQLSDFHLNLLGHPLHFWSILRPPLYQVWSEATNIPFTPCCHAASFPKENYLNWK